jgi:hypothetical protein
MGSILLEDFIVVGGNELLLHNGGHYFRRTLTVDLAALRDAVSAYNTHSLQVRVELKPSEDLSIVTAVAFESKDDVRIGVGLVEVEPAELKGLDLHGVADEFICGFDLDDGVVGSHIGEDSVEEGYGLAALKHLVDIWFIVENGGIELSLVGWHQCVEVHEVLSEGARLVEAAELNHTANDHLVLSNTVDALLFQSINRVDNAECHTDGQRRRHSDGNQVEEFLHEVLHLRILVDEDDEDDVGAN